MCTVQSIALNDEERQPPFDVSSDTVAGHLDTGSDRSLNIRQFMRRIRSSIVNMQATRPWTVFTCSVKHMTGFPAALMFGGPNDMPGL